LDLLTVSRYWAVEGFNFEADLTNLGIVIDFVHTVLGEFKASNSHTQLQRPKQTVYNRDTGAERPVTSDVPDLVSVHGTLEASELVAEGATLIATYKTGQHPVF
jgi:hypothetical protein